MKDESKRMKVIHFALSNNEQSETALEAIRIAQEYFDKCSSKASSEEEGEETYKFAIDHDFQLP